MSSAFLSNFHRVAKFIGMYVYIGTILSAHNVSAERYLHPFFITNKSYTENNNRVHDLITLLKYI